MEILRVGCLRAEKRKKYVLPPTTSSPQVLPRHENQVNCLPQLSKPYNLPSYPSYKRFTKVILSFSIKKSCKYLMRLLNHKNITKFLKSLRKKIKKS
jgi:hypothetical protein